MPIKQQLNSVSCGIRMTSPIRRLHSSSYDIYFILEQRFVLWFLLGSRGRSLLMFSTSKTVIRPHFLHLDSTTPRVLVDSNGITPGRALGAIWPGPGTRSTQGAGYSAGAIHGPPGQCHEVGYGSEDGY